MYRPIVYIIMKCKNKWIWNMFKWTFYFYFHLLPLDKWDLCKTGTLNVHSWVIKVIVNRIFWINYIMMKKKKKKKVVWLFHSCKGDIRLSFIPIAPLTFAILSIMTTQGWSLLRQSKHTQLFQCKSCLIARPRYMVSSNVSGGRRVSGITFIRYTHRRQELKPHSLKYLGARKPKGLNKIAKIR